jgi:hypothetical protein
VRDYNLDLLAVDLIDSQFVGEIKTEKIKGAAEAFVCNIDRLEALAKTPVSLFYWASVLGQNFILAYQEVMRQEYKFSLDPSSYESRLPEIVRLVQFLVSQTHSERMKDEADRKRIEGNTYKELLLLTPDHVPLIQSFEAILVGVVVGAWTSFEAFASELWVSAYDSLPPRYRANNGNQVRIEQRMDRDSESKEIQPKRKAQKFQGKDDLSGKELLAAAKATFASLSESRQHYSLLFSEKLGLDETGEIDGILADTRLDAVSLVRNLLVHKAGRADGLYVRDCGKYELAPRLELNETLTLDGTTVLLLVEAITKLGTKLAKAVDLWTQAAIAK